MKQKEQIYYSDVYEDEERPYEYRYVIAPPALLGKYRRFISAKEKGNQKEKNGSGSLYSKEEWQKELQMRESWEHVGWFRGNDRATLIFRRSTVSASASASPSVVAS